MRVLVLLRGAPGCGKSTWIQENNLRQYALSADELRLMCECPALLTDGGYGISQSNDKLVWQLLFQMLEARMQRSEFTVIDATNSKTIEMNRYKELADTYRFRIYCVDFTDLPIEECKRRNAQRPAHKIVPEEVIDKMYSRFATQKIPSGIRVIKPDELDTAWFKPADFSHYDKIHHIGDVHGCYTALKTYLEDGIHENELYIFTGDYIDRGLENVQVVQYLAELSKLPNVLLLEGNHERWLWYWAHGGTSKSMEFEKHTRRELEQAGVDPKMVRAFYRKLGQCAYYVYHDKLVFASHGGLSRLPDNLTKIAAEQMIRGVGAYSDFEKIAHNFDRLAPANTYQVYGHRNVKALPIDISERCFNLEGSVEFGGDLRIVTLDRDGFHPIYVKNEVFRSVEAEPQATEYSAAEQTVMELVDNMRNNRMIREKKFGDISSFNFSKDAFYSGRWDSQTMKARGLFINTVEGHVVARAYEKFFNINERPETKFDMLQHRLQFPVAAYLKENGFLGIVSYNAQTDDFFISSKSDPEGPFSEWLRDIFLESTTDVDKVKAYLKSNDVSLVFECIDPINDPHIIKYDRKHLVLLDVVQNTIAFSKLPYSQLTKVGQELGYSVKKLAYQIRNWQDFCRWYDEVQDADYTFEGEPIEGFVIEDSAGFMVKTKLSYYNTWKFMRSIAHETLRNGHSRRTSALTTPLHNHFYGWLKAHSADAAGMPTDIVSLRDMFYEKSATTN